MVNRHTDGAEQFAAVLAKVTASREMQWVGVDGRGQAQGQGAGAGAGGGGLLGMIGNMVGGLLQQPQQGQGHEHEHRGRSQEEGGHDQTRGESTLGSPDAG